MRKSKCGLLVLTATGVVLSAVLSSAVREEKISEPSKKVVGLLGDDTVAHLKNATKVETFRIKPEKTTDALGKHIGGYTIVATGKEEGKDFAARLDNVLFSDVTYEGRSAKCFEPGVAFRVWTDNKEYVDVILCFHCRNFTLTSYDAKGTILKERVYAPFGGTPSWTAFVKLAKEAFPDDKDIQNLREDVK